MADYYNIDDPLSQTHRPKASLAEETRRQRYEASQKRLRERKLKQEEKARVRRVKEEWERSQSQSVERFNREDVVDGGESDSSPDLMASPPPPRSSAASIRRVGRSRRERSHNDDSSDGSLVNEQIKKSTVKKSNRASKFNYDSDDSTGRLVTERKENVSGRTVASPYKRQMQPDANDKISNNQTNHSPSKFYGDNHGGKPEWQPKENQHDFIQSTAAATAKKASPTKKKKPWLESSDESSVDFESIKLARKKKQQSHKPQVKFSPKIRKRNKFAESSSSEDEAVVEERLRRRFEERKREALNSNSNGGDVHKFQQNRYSSSSGDSPKFTTNSNSSTNTQDPAPTAPKKRQTQQSSSEDEAILESRFRQSMEQKRLASYRRNPLSLAKKDEDDWKFRMDTHSSPKASPNGPRLHVAGEGLVGKEIVVNDNETKETVKENVSDLGGSQDRVPKRRRRGRISSPAPPEKKQVSVAKKVDDLWDDSEEERVVTKTDVKKPRGKVKTNTQDDEWQDAKKKQRKKESFATSPLLRKRPSPAKQDMPRKRNNKRVEKESSDEEHVSVNPKPRRRNNKRTEKESSDEEDHQQANLLKPNFDNPKLGPPGPLVPLRLSGNVKPAVEAAHEVPASINRYLKEYQRAGIQFMYSSVIEGKGCVLGDDMGLGKTVQVISLIAALLNKTGTGMDKVKVQRLRRDVAKAVEIKSKAELDKRLGISTDVDVEGLFDHIEQQQFAPILIIVPTSVIQNWVNEFETWGHFNVSVYQGPNREKAIDEVYDGSSHILIAGKSVITRETDFGRFLGVGWKLIFVDEFHEFKNHKTNSFSCLQQLRDDFQCPIVGMTGTLMQNNHEELFTLIDLVRPGLLEDRKSFMEYTSKPIKLARTKDAKDDIKRIGKQREQELMKTISPAYLERKKEVVLKDTLTRKNEKVIFCELSELQKKLYRYLLALPDYEMLRMANAPCGGCNINQQYFIGYKRMKTQKEQVNYQRRHKDELIPRKKCCFKYPYEGMYFQEPSDKIDPNAILWIQKHRKIIADPDAIPDGTEIIDHDYLGSGKGLISCKTCPMCISLSAMSKLHKVCSHPSLLQVDRTAPPGAETDKKLEFAKIAFPPDILSELPGKDYYRSDGIMDDHLKLSGKMKTLDYVLRRYLRKQNRVLIFSYSTATLDLIQQHVKTQGWTHLRLDGQTPTSSRQSLVDQFQKDQTISLFLISTRAGGLGLNLTAANKVIIFDVNWNPSYDEQAQDRSYRIGQENDVEVVRLVARGTIEEQMYARQVYKVQLKKQTLGGNIDGKNQPQIFKGVDKDDKRKGELFGLENLLNFRDGSFMQLLWKKSDNPNEAHDVSEIARFTEDDMNRAIEEAKEEEKAPYKSDSDDDKADKSAINHEDLFNMERGHARYAEGDEDYDEQMGGESQMIHVATNLACQNYDSDTTGGDEDAVDKARPKLESALETVKEEKDVHGSPVQSSSMSDTIKQPNSKHNGKENELSLSTEGTPPITQPTDVANCKKSETTHQMSRSKVSIMGVVFEESKSRKVQEKKSSLYIPSYSRSKKS